LLGLFISQLTIIGYLSLKEATLLAILAIPLPFLTLFFHYYVKNRFSPLVKHLTQEEIAETDFQSDLEKVENKMYLQKCLSLEPLTLSGPQSPENSVKGDA
jgi:hypothetical protein